MPASPGHIRARTCRCIMAAALFAVYVMAMPVEAASAGAAKGDTAAWVEYERGLAEARKRGAYVLIDFNTKWCRDCKKMDKEVFPDPELAGLLSEKFVAVKVDGDKRPELVSKYGVFAYPTFWLLEPGGGRITQHVGYISAQEMKTLLEYASSGAYKTMGLKEFAGKDKRGEGR